MMGFARLASAALTATALTACLAASPAFAQEKTKEKPGANGSTSAMQVLEDARSLCDRVASGDESVRDTLDELGWAPEVDAYGEVPYYHEIEAGKEYPGVGLAEIWGFIELYPSHVIGYCTFEIMSPEVDIPVAELNNMEGLTGGVERIDYGTYTSLVNDSEPHHVMIQARQTEDSFLYQVTDIIPRD